MENASVDHALKYSNIKIHSFSIWGVSPDAEIGRGVVPKPTLLYKYPEDANLPPHVRCLS